MKKVLLLLLILVSFFSFFAFSFVSAGTLQVTTEHPFLVNGEWIPASELEIGDVLQTIDGQEVRIKSIVEHSGLDNFSVYNLEASEYSNFVVCGEEDCSNENEVGVVVHNSAAVGASKLTQLSPTTEASLAGGMVIIEKTHLTNTKSIHLLTFNADEAQSTRAMLAALKYIKKNPHYKYTLHTPNNDLIAPFLRGDSSRLLTVLENQGFTVQDLGNIPPSLYEAKAYNFLSKNNPPSSAWQKIVLNPAKLKAGYPSLAGTWVEYPITSTLVIGGVYMVINPDSREIFIALVGLGRYYFIELIDP